MEDDSGIKIDAEKLTQYLLTVTGDKELSAKLIQEMAENTGLHPKKWSRS